MKACNKIFTEENLTCKIFYCLSINKFLMRIFLLSNIAIFDWSQRCKNINSRILQQKRILIFQKMCASIVKCCVIDFVRIIKSVIKNTTIEPVFLLFGFCLGIHLIAVEELYISKVCNVNLNYTKATCDNITVSLN